MKMKMTRTRETKGTVVFTEVTDEDRPHQFYILKRLDDDLEAPETIEVTINGS